MPLNSYNDIIDNALDNARNPIGQVNLQGTFLEKWFMPGQVQEREFGQQVALEKLQYEQSIDYKRQMEEMKKAGINPNLAAAGIAKAGSTESAPAVPATPDSPLPQAISDIANAVTGGFANIAKGKFDLGTLDPTIQNLDADFQTKMKELGLTDEQITALKISNKYLDEDWQLKLRIQGLNADNLSQQFKVFEAEYQLKSQMIDTELEKIRLMTAEEDLMSKESSYYDLLSQKTQLDRDWLQQKLDFWKQHGFDMESSAIDAILVQMIENGKDITPFINQLSSYYGSVSFEVAKGQYNADPYQQKFRDLYDYSQTLVAERADLDNVINDIRVQVRNGQLSRDKAKDILDKCYEQRKVLDAAIESAEHDFEKGKYQNGHATFWQGLANDVAGISLGAGMAILGRYLPGGKPVTVKGYGR